jgi:Phosphoenolpyruvate phosphomutase
MMSAQAAKAETFRSLHVSGRPLVLFNIWDAGSAKVVASQGARALATGSWSVAAANGFADGERVPLDLAIDNLARIVKANDLPVTVDLESGYGETAGEVAQSVARAIEAGAVGCNLEDSFPRDGSLREIGEQAEELPEPVEPPVIRVLPCSSMHGPTFSSRSRHRPMTKPWSAPRWIAPKYLQKLVPTASSSQAWSMKPSSGVL